MRPYIILLIIGVLVAGLAALAVRSTMTAPTQQAAQSAPVKTTRILVAQETITAGHFIRADKDLGWSEWPSEQVQSPPYIVEGESPLQDYNGAVARRTIFAGEPIGQGAVVRPGEGGFMSAVLQPGMRAVSLPVNATTGNAGFIFPGDYVDLILTHAIQNLSGQNFASETFVENVRVLAVDQMLDNPENKALLAKTVTLEVQPRQAEAINVALEMGKISLALRSLAVDDATQAAQAPAPAVETDAVKLEDFYPDTAAPTASDRHYTRDSDISRLLGGNGSSSQMMRVRVIRGETSSELEFRPPAQ